MFYKNKFQNNVFLVLKKEILRLMTLLSKIYFLLFSIYVYYVIFCLCLNRIKTVESVKKIDKTWWSNWFSLKLFFLTFKMMLFWLKKRKYYDFQRVKFTFFIINLSTLYYFLLILLGYYIKILKKHFIKTGSIVVEPKPTRVR